TGSSAHTDRTGRVPIVKAGDPDLAASSQARPGEGPTSFEALVSAERTYPANVIPTNVVANAGRTFDRIARADGDVPKGGHGFIPYGPTRRAYEPGIIAFSGATDVTASRVTAMLVAPTCVKGNCRLWVGVAGGGVWRTEDALSSNPTWRWLDAGLGTNSI